MTKLLAGVAVTCLLSPRALPLLQSQGMSGEPNPDPAGERAAIRKRLGEIGCRIQGILKGGQMPRDWAETIKERTKLEKQLEQLQKGLLTPALS